jgi:hypothetical protein
MAHALDQLVLPGAEQIVLQAFSTWDGVKTEEAFARLRARAIENLQKAEWGVTKEGVTLLNSTPTLLQVLAIGMAAIEPGDRAGYARTLQRLAHKRNTMRKCARPGCCVTAVGKYRWKHGLCDDCNASRTACPQGMAAAWLQCEPVPTFAPNGFISIPEREFAMPDDVQATTKDLFKVSLDELRATRETYLPAEADGHIPAGVLVGYGISGGSLYATRKSFIASVRGVLCRILRIHNMVVEQAAWDNAYTVTRDTTLAPFRLHVVPVMSEHDWLAGFPGPRRGVLA